MAKRADVCLLLEGTYPYVMGGVSSWTHALIGAAPHLTFHIVSILPDRQEREKKYEFPKNVVGHTHVFLDSGHIGRAAHPWDGRIIEAFGRSVQGVIARASMIDFASALELLERSKLGQRALLDSRTGWRAMESAYAGMLPNAPLLEFFWTWRVLTRSIISLMATPLPQASIYHAISTGYAGVLGARARTSTDGAFVVTEHGIYTNERRIEIGLADWLFDSGRGGFGVDHASPELRDLWLNAFSSFARLAYDSADLVTTLYTGNQAFQQADGAVRDKLRVIPNGVDYARYSRIVRQTGARRPTVALIGRVVSIKDVRTFIFACAALRKRVPDVEALILGPEDEEPAYAAECRELVAQEKLEDCVRFTGRVDISAHLGAIDVIALTSISEAQPLVILEAGAAGIPTVATDVGSCREILEGFALDPVKGRGGIVAPVGDAAAIAQALGDILLDGGMRAAMGDVMRRRVESFYNKTVVDRVYNEMYADLLREAPGAREAVAWPA